MRHTKRLILSSLMVFLFVLPGASQDISSGTCWALGNGYLVTNHHVVEDADDVAVVSDGKFFPAQIIATDPRNDLAIIRVEDKTFNGYKAIPYSFKTSRAEVGESCFTLGYPLISAMGGEVKLTNGIISSQSGYMGDVTTYQISAPVQPGNSGGPLFDSKGRVIGIVSSGIPGADNVGYAIKVSCLKALMDAKGVTAITPQGTSLANLGLVSQVKAISPFVYVVVCASGANGNTAKASSDIPSGAVDLGLSVKWASCNLGASKPEEYGLYYQWGDTFGYGSNTSDGKYFDWKDKSGNVTYKWCNGSSKTLTKYNTKSDYGWVYYKTTLELGDDAASVALGGKWRIPTDAEWTELRESCSWTWTTMNGVKGYKVQSKKPRYTGNWIFLPAAGYQGLADGLNIGSFGYYWSSALNTDKPSSAYIAYFSSSLIFRTSYARCYGQSVRPVWK